MKKIFGPFESCDKKGKIHYKSRLFSSGFSQGIQWARRTPHSLRCWRSAPILGAERKMRGSRRSEVRYLMGTQNFFLCPTLVIRRKISLFLYRAQTFHLSCSKYKVCIVRFALCTVTNKLSSAVGKMKGCHCC